MRAKIICYSLGKRDSVRRRDFHRKMYGYVDKSNYGKYTYTRKGLLGNIKHRKIQDGVIIVGKNDFKVVVKLLREYDAKVHIFDIFANFRL